MQRKKWTATIFLIGFLVGIVHAMNHFEFYALYSRLLNDVDELLKSIADYVANAVVRLGTVGRIQENKLVEVVENYEIMMTNAQPLFHLFCRDFWHLIEFFNNLESIHLAKKFLYAYFRQSAINLIDHLKRVYELF